MELATGQVFTVPPEELESATFPFWQEAVHDILILTGCQCVCHDHNEAKCFLSIGQEMQIILHSGGKFSFEGF